MKFPQTFRRGVSVDDRCAVQILQRTHYLQRRREERTRRAAAREPPPGGFPCAGYLCPVAQIPPERRSRRGCPCRWCERRRAPSAPSTQTRITAPTPTV